MLDPSAIDLEMLTIALQDNSYDSSWWLDPATGEVLFCSIDDDDDTFEERGLILVDSGEPHAAYRDMEIFAAGVEDAQLSERLERAIRGRGAFRYFRDVLSDHEQVLQEWYDFRDQRMTGRALDWLAFRNVITQEAADAAWEDL
jgi:hypothetical protein